MNIDRLQTLTNSQPNQGPLLAAGWLAQMVENWRARFPGHHMAAFADDDELRDLGPSRHAVEHEMGKAVWYG